MPSSHLILCRPLLLPPSVFPGSIRVFFNKAKRTITFAPIIIPCIKNNNNKKNCPFKTVPLLLHFVFALESWELVLPLMLCRLTSLIFWLKDTFLWMKRVPRKRYKRQQHISFVSFGCGSEAGLKAGLCGPAPPPLTPLRCGIFSGMSPSLCALTSHCRLEGNKRALLVLWIKALVFVCLFLQRVIVSLQRPYGMWGGNSKSVNEEMNLNIETHSHAAQLQRNLPAVVSLSPNISDGHKPSFK